MKCKCCGQELPAKPGILSLEPPPVNGNAVAYIPLVNGTEFGVSADMVAELEAAYPAVDVPLTLFQIRAWNISNPKLRKTKAGVMRHINIWCAREQDKGPRG